MTFSKSVQLFRASGREILVFCLILATSGFSDAAELSAEGTDTAIPEATPVDLSTTVLHRMKNDLPIVMQAISGAPELSVCTSLDAGSRLDPREAPGAYRVLGEMLKQGGYRSTSRDFAALVARRGGVSELAVTHEGTRFCTTVPASELSLALWVTAGRFTSGSLTRESMKKAVDHLARKSAAVDARVRTGRAGQRLRKMAYLGTDSLARPVLPNADDLDALSIETIRRLHRESYVARRATIAIVGGFDAKAAIPMFSEHLFAARPGTESAYQVSSLVPQTTARFSMAEDKSSKTPAAWYGWVLPAGEDRLAAQVALSALVSDKRLGRSLVGKGRAAKSISLDLDEEAAPQGHAFCRVEVVGSNSRSLGTVEKGFDKQLRQLAIKGPSSEEVAHAQARLRRQKAQRLITSLGRSRALATGVRLGLNPEEILRPLDEDAPFTELSTSKVRLAAARLLSSRRRSSVEIYPKGWQDPWQQPMRKYHIVEKGQTLGSIAQRYGLSVAALVKMNGVKRKKTIYPGDKLRVPRGRVKKVKPLRTHQVRRGDTLGGLALKYGVSSRSIADSNGMGAKSTIRTGETLRIPWGKGAASSKSGGKKHKSGSGNPKPAPASRRHKVKSGESLSGIAAKMGVSTVALARANGISQKSGVRIGQTLKVPPVGTGKKGTSGKTKAKKPAPMKSYKVRKGDTLSGIAKRNGVSVAELTVANGISRKSTLRLGQKLKIPSKSK